MRKTILFAALLCAAAPTFAGSQYLTIDEAAQLTGMEKREVQLMLGAYSNNPLYRTSFLRVSQEWNDKARAAGIALQSVRDDSGRVVAVRIVRYQHQG